MTTQNNYHTKAILLIILLLILTLTITKPTAQALLTTQPPPPSTQWQTPDLGANVESVSWSPSGDKLAAGGRFRKVMVYDSSGNLLWQTGDLGAWVYSVAWSPSGDKLAAGLDNGTVIVFDSSGTMVWQSENLGAAVRSVAWSPDGSKLAVGGDFDKVIVFDSNGNQLWETPDLGKHVLSASWCPQGDKLAVGTGWEDNGYHGQVIVFDSSGIMLWQTGDLGDYVRSVAWSPAGDKLVAGGWFKKVVVYDGSGNLLWQTGDLGAWVNTVAWSPQGDKIVAGLTSGYVIVFDSSGNQLWQTPDLGPWVNSVAWNPNGDKLAVGGDFQKAIVYSFDFGFLVLQAPSCCGVDLMLEDVGNGTRVNLTLDPGETRTVYALGQIKITINTLDGQPVIGPPITTKINKTQTKTINLQNILARLTLTNPTDGNTTSANITITWNSGQEILALEPGETAWYWAAPGYYTIQAQLAQPTHYLGDPASLTKTLTITLTAGQNENITIPRLDEVLGKLTIKNPETNTNTSLTITWETGARYLSLQPGQVIEYWASPGNYTLNITLEEPDNFIGNPNTLKTSTNIQLAAGEQKQQTIPRLDQLLAQLTITNPTGIDSITASITITWIGGSKTLTLERGETTRYWASPGEYTVTIELGEPENHIGPPVSLTKQVNITLQPGENKTVIPPGLNAFLGRIAIKNPPGENTTTANITITWSGGSETLTLEPGETTWYWATPTNYTLQYTYKPQNYIGNQQALRHETSIILQPGQNQTITIPPLNTTLARLNLENPAGENTTTANITITWNNGQEKIVLEPGESTWYWASPGLYSMVVELEEPENYIGPSTSLAEQVNISLSPEENTRMTLPSLNTYLARLTLENPTGENATSANVTITWSRGSRTLALEPGQAVQYWAGPGEYSVGIELGEPEHYVGPVDVLSTSRRVVLQAGGAVRVEVPRLNMLLGRVSIENPSGSSLRVVVGVEGESREFIVPPGGNLTLWVHPGRVRVDAWRIGLLGWFYSGVSYEADVGAGGVWSVSPEPPLGVGFYLTVVLVVLAVYFGVFHPWVFVAGLEPGEVVFGVGNRLVVRLRKRGLLPARKKITVEVDGRVIEKEIVLKKRGEYRVEFDLDLS